MDVVALDQAGFRESSRRSAPRSPRRSSACSGSCPPPRFCASTATLRARKRACARRCALCPMSAPAARWPSSPCRPGKDPDDLIRASGRARLRGAAGEPGNPRRPALAARARGRAAHDAGAARRAQAPADGPCRDDRGPGRARAISLRAAAALQRLDPAAAERRPWTPGPGGRFGGGTRFPRPARPTTAEAKALGRTGLSPELARAVLLGLARFPALIGEHAEEIAALDLSERDAARVRDLMVEAAMMNAALDPEALNTILAAEWRRVSAGDSPPEARTGVFLHAT